MSSSRNEPQLEYMRGTSDYVVKDVLEIPTYQLENSTMRVYDVVWGEEYIGDEEYDDLLLQLARSPLFRRLQAVEQLTLPADYTTIPNTSRFSRWQHIWGSLVFVRKMTKDDERYSERDRIILQLRTLFSDVGQTAFSHLGDWLFQTEDTSEDLHDQQLRELLETFHVDELLNDYGLTLDETVFPEVEDWVECPSPDLCVDRVDYGLREILRWMSPPSPIFTYKSNLAHPKSLFTINDERMLEITDVDFARKFAYAYNLLPTEHWAQPVHRLQLELMQTAVKNALLDGHFSDGIFLKEQTHPRDRLYGIDSDFRFAFQQWGGATLSRTMQSIGLAQRQIYSSARQYDLAQILRQDSDAIFPDPLTSYSWQSEAYGLVAPQVEIEQTDDVSRPITLGKIGLTLGLKPLKARSVDPLLDSGNRLSQVDSDFATYRTEQSRVMAQGYEASLLLNRETTRRLYDMFTSTNDRWEAAASKPRDLEDLREIIGQAALYGAGHRFDTITDW
jgi:hypothetical protein